MIDNLTEAARLLNATQLMLLGKDNQPISDLYYALQIAVDAIEELQERREADKWISVKDNLPDKNDFVLVYDGSDMFVAWYENEGMSEGWHSFDETYDRYTPIIAWRPLPKFYEIEDK